MSKFSSIESLENWVTWDYLRGTLKWSPRQIAYEMDVNEQRLIEWVNARTSAMNKLTKAQVGKVEKLDAALEKLYAEKPKEDALPSFDIKKVVKWLKDEYKLHEIATMLKCERGLFNQWYTDNLPNINATLKRYREDA